MPGPANQADKNSNTIISDTIITFLQLYHTIFRTMTFLMPEPCSKSCQIAKVMKHIENPGIVRMLYSGIFRDIQPFSGMMRGIKAYSGI